MISDSSFRRHLFLVIFLMLAAQVPIWSVTFFPTQNGPWFLLTVKMFRDMNNPEFNYSEYYRISWHVIPYLLHNSIVYVASLFVDILNAHKVAVSIYVFLFPLSVFYFLSAAAPRGLIWGYLSFLLVFNYPLFRGYQNFALAIPMFLFAFSYWIRHRDQWTAKRLVILNVLVMLVYLSHLIVFGLLAISMSAWALWETRRLSSIWRTYLIGFVPSSVFFVDYVILTVRSNWVGEEGVRYLPIHWKVQYFFYETFYPISTGSWPWGFTIALLPFVFVVVCLLRAVAHRLKNHKWAEAPAPNALPIALLLAMFIALFWIVPYKIAGWHHVSTRFPPFVVIFAIALVACLYHLRRPHIFLTVVISASLALFAWLTFEIQQLDAAVKSYVAGLDKIDRNCIILPVMALEENTAFGRIRPMTRAHEYYHIDKGGANGKGIAKYNTLVPVLYKTYPVTDTFPYYRPKRPEESMQAISRVYDYVVVWGRDESTERIIEGLTSNDFTLYHHRHQMRIYQNMAKPGEPQEKLSLRELDQGPQKTSALHDPHTNLVK